MTDIPDPQITDEEAAELTAYMDDTLPAERRAAIESRLAADPGLAEAVDRRRRAAALVQAAAGDAYAPHDLRLRVDAAGRRPALRPRRRWQLFSGLAAAGAAAAAVVVVIGFGGGLDVQSTLAAATRPPIAAAAIDPVQPRLLRERVDQVRFPNFAEKFAFVAVGSRADEVEGRATRTVFYERDGRRIAYTIVAGDALDEPEDARRSVRDGVELRTLRSGDRTVVTWQRQGHTCVLSGEDVDETVLEELAAWKGQGDVRF